MPQRLKGQDTLGELVLRARLLAFIWIACLVSVPVFGNGACPVDFARLGQHPQPVAAVLAEAAETAPSTILNGRVSKLESHIDNILPSGRSYRGMERFQAAARRLRAQGGDEVEELIAKGQAAMQKRLAQGHDALEIDFKKLGLPDHMVEMLDGPWRKAVGRKGTSEPFVSFRAIDADTLEIRHAGDKIPLRVQWADVNEIQEIRNVPQPDKSEIKLLVIPKQMRTREQMADLEKNFPELIASSRMSPYILAAKDPLMYMTAAIHTPFNMVNDRPSQRIFRTVMDSFTDNRLTNKMRSMLYVAPTGSGKTRVLGISAIERIKQFHRLKGQMSDGQKNPIIFIMAKEPQLVDQLGEEIGMQLADGLPRGGYRMIQWGGTRGETDNLDKLLEQIAKNPNEPVVIVSSSQSMFMKTRQAQNPENVMRLLSRTNFVAIDEAHLTKTDGFQLLIQNIHRKADWDRGRRVPKDLQAFVNTNEVMPLSGLGVTATPFDDGVRAVETFDQSYWAYLDTPGVFRQGVTTGKRQTESTFDWVRVPLQLELARLNGEITAPKAAKFVDPSEVFRKNADGNLPELFQTITTPNGGYVTYVNYDLMPQVWRYLSRRVNTQATGVIDAYPRDSMKIAQGLARESKLNFVPLDPRLTSAQQEEIISTFRNRTVFQGRTFKPETLAEIPEFRRMIGRKIDYIVGPMRAGMDFPHIQNYISLKKTVAFPEMVQGPGRAYRLFLDKPIPGVFFFGEAPEAKAYRSIKDLVFGEAGALPEAFQGASRSFAGKKYRMSEEFSHSALGPLSARLNNLAEHQVRQTANRMKIDIPANEDSLSKMLDHVRNPAHQRSPEERNLERLLDQMKRRYTVLRSSRHEQELSDVLQDLTAQLNSFPFFRGTMGETTRYVDLLKRLEKLEDAEKGIQRVLREIENDKTKLSPELAAWVKVPENQAEILKQLKDPETMKQVREFGEFTSWLGKFTGQSIADVDLTPRGVHGVADAVTAFVQRNGRLPERVPGLKEGAYHPEDFLRRELESMVNSNSSATVMDRMGFHAQVLAEDLIAGGEKADIPTRLFSFVQKNQTFPEDILSKLDEGLFSHNDMIGHGLSRQLRARVEAGLLDYGALKRGLEAQGDPALARQILQQFDESEVYRRAVQPVITGLEMKLQVARELGQSPVISAKDLSELNRRMRAAEEMARDGLPVSKALVERYQELLRQFGRGARIEPAGEWFSSRLEHLFTASQMQQAA